MKEITYYAIDDKGMNKDNTLTIPQEREHQVRRIFNFFGNTIVSNLKTPLLSQEFKK